MLSKEEICNKCNKKCILKIVGDSDNIEVCGNMCNEGIKCINEEINNRKDIFTSLVRIKGAKISVVSVKSNKALEKSLWVECSKALSRLHVGAPIKIGDIICKNILNTGVDIVCTKNIDR